jgi:ADP-heptose:LPS heptosyltransferase
MTKLLVYRFSAMGDVILLLPVLKGVLAANADIEIYLLTQPGFFPLFQDIDRLHLIEADLKNKHRSVSGLFKLYRKIKYEIQPDQIIDLHCVIRTYILDFFFWVSGDKVISFKKGTFQKSRIVKSKLLKPIPGTIDRYSDAFVTSGFPVVLSELPVFPEKDLPAQCQQIFIKPIIIGIAPFAKHQQKIWGIHKIESLIEGINRFRDVTILLFGGGKSELQSLDQLAEKFSNCIVSAHHFNLTEEIKVMSRLSVMVSMDSANMHLASMAGVPTVSIWGATHPSLGFAPYKQPVENLIQYTGDKLSCRPCSVYGNKKCIYSDGIRCMEYIPVDMVLERINQILSISGY